MLIFLTAFLPLYVLIFVGLGSLLTPLLYFLTLIILILFMYFQYYKKYTLKVSIGEFVGFFFLSIINTLWSFYFLFFLFKDLVQAYSLFFIVEVIFVFPVYIMTNLLSWGIYISAFTDAKLFYKFSTVIVMLFGIYNLVLYVF